MFSFHLLFFNHVGALPNPGLHLFQSTLTVIISLVSRAILLTYHLKNPWRGITSGEGARVNLTLPDYQASPLHPQACCSFSERPRKVENYWGTPPAGLSSLKTERLLTNPLSTLHNSPLTDTGQRPTRQPACPVGAMEILFATRGEKIEFKCELHHLWIRRKETVVWEGEETAEEVFDLCISQKATEPVNNCLQQYPWAVNKKQFNHFYQAGAQLPLLWDQAVRPDNQRENETTSGGQRGAHTSSDTPPGRAQEGLEERPGPLGPPRTSIKRWLFKTGTEAIPEVMEAFWPRGRRTAYQLEN